MLHIINKSFPAQDVLQSCISHLSPNDAILLYEDGVLNSIKDTSGSELIIKLPNSHPIYVLLSDLEARGISDRVIAGITLINYHDFVDLVIKYNKVQSWN